VKVKNRLVGRRYAVLTVFLFVAQVIALFNAVTQPAYAYVDPGSGLLAFQMMSTTFAGVVFMVRKRLLGLLKTMRSRAKSAGAE
jgi:hypothetical protein